MKKYYAVFGIFNSIEIKGVKTPLQSGQYLIPVFEDYEKAKKYAGNRFNVVEVVKDIEEE